MISRLIGPTWRQSIHRLSRRRAPRAIILLYHRVADLESDPQLLSVSPARFDEHLAVLNETCRTMRLTEIFEGLSRGSLPERAVAITFDDGYADNFTSACPLLEQHAIPATVFVTTGGLDSDREFWWDELERLILAPSLLPAVLELDIDGAKGRWPLDERSRHRDREHDRWDVLAEPDPSMRHSLYRTLCSMLRQAPHETRVRVLDSLQRWAGLEACGRTTHRGMSRDQLRALAKSELIEIGAHTVTHSVLKSLSDAAQEWEITTSKATLENLLDREVRSFSYPFGTRYDYSENTTAIVRGAGFQCACANEAGIAEGGTDVYQLPRVPARNVSGDALSILIDDAFAARMGEVA